MSILANGICGGEPEDAVPAALALEILHNFTLVHDDIMDRAETRRGMESVFHKWDTNRAILSGDVMFAYSMRQLHHYGESDTFSKEEYHALNQVFQNAVIIVCEGQSMDMDFVDRQKVNHHEYLKMIGGKTAALLGASLEMGAITAHAHKTSREKMHALGTELGLAFQIQDDLLDATADPETFGKKRGGDIYEGKKTYLTILALERAEENDRAFIQNVLDNPQPKEEDVEKTLSLFEELKILDDISDEVNEHYNRAESILNEFPDSSYRSELSNLILFLKNRDH